jgi:cobalamin biosynthesis protein CobD/CbiB
MHFEFRPLVCPGKWINLMEKSQITSSTETLVKRGILTTILLTLSFAISKSLYLHMALIIRVAGMSHQFFNSFHEVNMLNTKKLINILLI